MGIKKGGGGISREGERERLNTCFMFSYLLIFDQPNSPMMWARKNNFI